MLTLLLVDSALELVPSDIVLHSSVIIHAKRRGKRTKNLILDSSLHHTAMKKLKDANRRGRPDLVHTFLLVALESVLNLEGGLHVLVHTYDNKLLRFDSQIRLPKNYNRFIGLIEQLYEAGMVPRELTEDINKPLIKLEHNKKVPEIVESVRAEAEAENKKLKVVTLSDKGKPVNPGNYFRAAAESGSDMLCLLGGFPEGSFKTDLSKIIIDDTISVYPEPLKLWTAAMEILVNYRREKIMKTD